MNSVCVWRLYGVNPIANIGASVQKKMFAAFVRFALVCTTTTKNMRSTCTTEWHNDKNSFALTGRGCGGEGDVRSNSSNCYVYVRLVSEFSMLIF